LYEGSPEAFYRQTIASTWTASIQVAEQEAPLAYAVLAMAAYLAPDAIPLALFDVLLDDSSDAYQRKRLIDAIRALDRYSLAEVQYATLSMHRLLQRVVRDSDTNRALQQVAGYAALTALTEAMPPDPALPEYWPQYEQLLPHVLRAHDLANDGVAGVDPQCWRALSPPEATNCSVVSPYARRHARTARRARDRPHRSAQPCLLLLA
ncbi:MAG: hypothetical protein M3Q52_05145, partial [Pseudomonadota bacterium]|nr:hypothetical protein [Pseudomonadota bacterium]